MEKIDFENWSGTRASDYELAEFISEYGATASGMIPRAPINRNCEITFFRFLVRCTRTKRVFQLNFLGKQASYEQCTIYYETPAYLVRCDSFTMYLLIVILIRRGYFSNGYYEKN